MRVLTIGSVVLDPDRDEAFVNGRPVLLTPAERAILRLLVRRRGSVVTRTELMMTAWNSAAPGRGQELEEQMNALRAKLEGGGVAITSMPGIGYSLT